MQFQCLFSSLCKIGENDTWTLVFLCKTPKTSGVNVASCTMALPNFSLSARADGQRVPVWPASVGMPLGSPDSLLRCKFQLIVLLNRRNRPPNYHVIARSRPQGRRRGNLLLRGMIWKYPINIVNPGYSMLIGPYFFVLRCWRFPRQGFALPRNDIPDGALQVNVKYQFEILKKFWKRVLILWGKVAIM